MKAITEDLDRREAKLVQATFAGWKLDMMKAMAFDANLQPSDVRIAFALLHHLNGSTWLLYPSQETLAGLTHMSVRNVIKCLSRLQSSGWLRWSRGNRLESNEYEFIADHLGEALAQLKADEKDRRSLRSRGKKRGDDMNSSSRRAPIPTCTPVHVPTRTTVHTNTLRNSDSQTKRAVK